MSDERPIRDEVDPALLAEEAAQEGTPLPSQEEPAPTARGWAWLRARTGKRPLSDYREHPLRPVAADGWARILRGFEGILGDLDLAVIDIGMGLIGLMYDLMKKKEAATNEPAAGAAPGPNPVDPGQAPR